MKISTSLTDNAILQELGERLARCRLDSALTQASLAEQAGVSKSTIERLEDGESVQLINLVRVLRALNLTSGLEALAPETAVRPLDVLEHNGQRRRRVRPGKHSDNKDGRWSWGDEK